MAEGVIISPENSKRLSELQRTKHLEPYDQFLVARHEPALLNRPVLLDLGQELDVKVVLDGLAEAAELLPDESLHFLADETRKCLSAYGVHNSFRVTYGQLLDDICRDLSGMFDFGTMAFRERWEYSRSSHLHGYDKVAVRPYYDLSTSMVVDITRRGEVSSYQIGFPKIEVPTYTECSVGEIRLVAVPNRRQPDPNSEDFDGWVYCDGQEYSKDTFPMAYDFFRNAPGTTSTSFKVPELGTFVKPNSHRESPGVQFHEHVNALVAHTHGDIDNGQFSSYSEDTTINIPLSVYNEGGGSLDADSLHTGYEFLSGQMTNISIDINAQTLESSPTQTSYEGSDEESWPEHVRVPALVYIGYPEGPYHPIEPDMYSVNVIISPSGAGSATGAGTYEKGTTATLAVTPAFGYEFVRWDDGSRSLSRQYVVTGNKTFTAYFSEVTPEVVITTGVTPEGGGEVTGAGTYQKGDAVELKATPAQDYTFKQWSDGQTLPSITFAASQDAEYVATFKYSISLSDCKISYLFASGSIGDSWHYDGDNSAWTSGSVLHLCPSETICQRTMSVTHNGVRLVRGTDYSYSVTRRKDTPAPTSGYYVLDSTYGGVKQHRGGVTDGNYVATTYKFVNLHDPSDTRSVTVNIGTFT